MDKNQDNKDARQEQPNKKRRNYYNRNRRNNRKQGGNREKENGQLTSLSDNSAEPSDFAEPTTINDISVPSANGTAPQAEVALPKKDDAHKTNDDNVIKTDEIPAQKQAYKKNQRRPKKKKPIVSVEAADSDDLYEENGNLKPPKPVKKPAPPPQQKKTSEKQKNQEKGVKPQTTVAPDSASADKNQTDSQKSATVAVAEDNTKTSGNNNSNTNQRQKQQKQPNPETGDSQRAERSGNQQKKPKKPRDAQTLPEARSVKDKKDITASDVVVSDNVAESTISGAENLVLPPVIVRAPTTGSTPETVESTENVAQETEKKKDKTEIIGVRFRDGGKIYYFAPCGYETAVGDGVIVETARGVEYGTVAIANRSVSFSDVVSPLKNMLRKANEADKKHLDDNHAIEEKARHVFEEKAVDFKLKMTLVDVELTFDNTKLLFYFTAEGRIDFRELVKSLASIYKTRIELRQIGVRDEAKQLGGLGICGRPFCCKTFLDDFQQVSIKMAKDQNLSLNSAKISGTCGRLMCCLRYENDVYEEEAKITPRVESIVESPMGRGVVIEANVLSGICKVRLDSKPDAVPEKIHRSSLKVVGMRRVEETVPEELKALEE